MIFQAEINPRGNWCWRMFRDARGQPNITTGDFSGATWTCAASEASARSKEMTLRHVLRLERLPKELDIPLRTMALGYDAQKLIEMMEREP
jgi:hypothetical protein